MLDENGADVLILQPKRTMADFIEVGENKPANGRLLVCLAFRLGSEHIEIGFNRSVVFGFCPVVGHIMVGFNKPIWDQVLCLLLFATEADGLLSLLASIIMILSESIFPNCFRVLPTDFSSDSLKLTIAVKYLFV